MNKRLDGKRDDSSRGRYGGERGMLTRPPDPDLYGRAASGRRSAATPLRLAGGVVGILCLLALLGLLLRGALTAWLPGAVGVSQATPSPTAETALPAFTDWRVAYDGADDRLHAVSLDGRTDVAGTTLPLVTNQNEPTFPTASPDGHYLAYPGYRGEIIVGLTKSAATAAPLETPHRGSYTAFWSPDGTRVVGSLGGRPGIWITTVGSWQEASVPGTPLPGVSAVIGWVDPSHLLLRVVRPGATAQQLDAIDVSTGALRTIASFSFADFGSARFMPSPDGRHILVIVSASGGEGDNRIYTPLWEVIDTATGQVHKLPNTLKLLGTDSYAAAWRPGSTTLAASTGELPAPSGHPDLFKLWLVDIQHDTARQIPSMGYPLAWAPGDDSHTLITSTSRNVEGNGGPYTISAVTIPDAGTPVVTTLTQSAMTYPLLGLVRTA